MSSGQIHDLWAINSLGDLREVGIGCKALFYQFDFVSSIHYDEGGPRFIAVANSMPNSTSSNSQLATPVRYGCFLWWPVHGVGWIHEDDRFVAEHLIPGKRIFSCVHEAEGWNLYQYGRLSFRARPCMWTELVEPEFAIGEFVEVESRMGKNRPMIAAVREVFWNRAKRRAEFQLSIAGRRLVRLYSAEELQLSARIGSLPDLAKRFGKLRHGGYVSVELPVEEVSDNEELRLRQSDLN